MTPLTPKDIVGYITMIRLYYPKAFPISADPDKAEQEREVLLKSFYLMIKDYPKEVVDIAVVNAIKNFNYGDYPKPANIIAEIEKLQDAYAKDENELWSELMGVLRKVADNAYCLRFNALDYNGLTQGENARLRLIEIFDNLSPELKTYCVNVDGLVTISAYTEKELSFAKNAFKNSLASIRKRAKIRQETGDLSGLLQGLSDNLRLECCETKQIK